MKKQVLLGTIPVRPHLYNIAMITENRIDTGFLDLSNGTLIAYQLNSLLHGKTILPTREDHEEALSNSKDLYFRFTATHLARGRVAFKKSHITFFNKWLHLFMHELLEIKIHLGKNYGLAEAEVIWNFISEYELDGLIEFDALKKTQQRVRNRKKIYENHGF